MWRLFFSTDSKELLDPLYRAEFTFQQDKNPKHVVWATWDSLGIKHFNALKWSSQSPDLSSIVFWCCSRTFSIQSDWAWPILQRETDRIFHLLQISVTKCDKVQRAGAFLQNNAFIEIYSICWEVVVQLILSNLKTNLTLCYNWTCSPGYTKTNFKSTPMTKKKNNLSQHAVTPWADFL